jgi:hypothetical protein
MVTKGRYILRLKRIEKLSTDTVIVREMHIGSRFLLALLYTSICVPIGFFKSHSKGTDGDQWSQGQSKWDRPNQDVSEFKKVNKYHFFPPIPFFCFFFASSSFFYFSIVIFFAPPRTTRTLYDDLYTTAADKRTDERTNDSSSLLFCNLLDTWPTFCFRYWIGYNDDDDDKDDDDANGVSTTTSCRPKRLF